MNYRVAEITQDTPEIRQMMVEHTISILATRIKSIKEEFDAVINMIKEEFATEPNILRLYYELDEKGCKVTLVSENDNMEYIISTNFKKFQKIKERFPLFKYEINPLFIKEERDQYLNYSKMICFYNRDE